MTEAEWLTDTDGAALTKFWSQGATERKGRLLMLACCRRRAQHFVHPVLREAVAALAAHYADPTAPAEPFDRAEYDALSERLDGYQDEQNEDDVPDAVPWVTGAVKMAARPKNLLARDRQTFEWAVWSCVFDAGTEGLDDDRPVPGEREAQAELVREVVGNPFRPVALDPAWRTDTVLALARQMYSSEDFSAAPILADALQDAGCDANSLLSHLRDPQANHVRGCWAIDLVLGLS